MKKKLISILMVLVIILSSFALSLTAYANSQELILNQQKTTLISGYGDLEWFYYTPDQSGLYTFMSMNVNRSIGYLCLKENNPETGMPEIKTIAYGGAFSDPNYRANGHNEFQFAITYHLEKGVTYWLAVGWEYMDTTRAQYNVYLRLDSYDENAIESIELINVPELTAYVDGEASVDAKGKSYFRYDISKIIRNATIIIHYSNGTSSQPAKGQEVIDGYRIKWIDNQIEKHWYPDADPEHTQNIIGVSVLDKTTTYDVKLNIEAMTFISGRVVNLAGQPVGNASILFDGLRKAYTDENGDFRFYCSAGVKNLVIKTATSIDYEKTIVVSTISDDMSGLNYVICNCDYVKDGYANAKDFSYIRHNFTGAKYEKLVEEYQASINFSKSDYQ